MDLDNLTGRALEALLDPALADLAVDVVLGSQSPHRHAVEKLVNSRPKTTLHGPLPSLAGLIARADLAIGAGGVTNLERACLGLPSVVVAIAANQLEPIEAFAKEHCLIQISFLDFEVQIRALLVRLISHPDWLVSASVRTANFVDGSGVTITCRQMLGND